MSTNAQATSRLDFVDAHRGLAVLLMVWMHSADGWLRPEFKQGATWDLIRSVGGLAAPTFLLLAGVGLALGWRSEDGLPADPARAGARQRGEIARGLQLMVLGYALRLQMWMLDGAGYRLAEAWAAAIPLACAYAAAYFGLDAWAKGTRTRGFWAMAALGGALGFALIAELLPARLGPLLRVDVLQAIGASLVVLSLLSAALRRTPELGLALALGIALATPEMRLVMPGPLPPAMAGYLAQWEVPRGQLMPTLFPLFPWLAYALAGAVIGLRLGAAARHQRASAARVALLLAALGIVLAVLTCEPLRPARALIASQPWLAPAVRMTYRVAVALVLGGAAVLICTGRVPLLGGSLVALGRASLIVYWLHLQFAFGAAVKPIVHQLDVRQWANGLALFATATIVFAVLWVRLQTWLRSRARSANTARAAGANPAPLAGA